jgi:hypothetical protein
MGKMAELAAELEMRAEPCGHCETARELAEQYTNGKVYAVGSYAEKLKEAFQAGYKAGIGPHHLIMDLPDGERYGFPKRLPDGTVNIMQWLIENGYPKDKVESAMLYGKFWKE